MAEVSPRLRVGLPKEIWALMQRLGGYEGSTIPRKSSIFPPFLKKLFLVRECMSC